MKVAAHLDTASILQYNLVLPYCVTYRIYFITIKGSKVFMRYTLHSSPWRAWDRTRATAQSIVPRRMPRLQGDSSLYPSLHSLLR